MMLKGGGTVPRKNWSSEKQNLEDLLSRLDCCTLSYVHCSSGFVLLGPLLLHNWCGLLKPTQPSTGLVP